MCVEFWCLAHERWDFSSAPIYSCRLTSYDPVTANVPSSRSVEYPHSYYVKMTSICSKVGLKIWYINAYVCIWQHISLELHYPQHNIKSRFWNCLLLFSSKSMNYSNNNKKDQIKCNPQCIFLFRPNPKEPDRGLMYLLAAPSTFYI